MASMAPSLSNLRASSSHWSRVGAHSDDASWGGPALAMGLSLLALILFGALKG